MNKDELQAMSPIKQAVISQLMIMSQVTQISPDTLALSTLIHAVTGAALLNKEAELALLVMPHIEKMKVEAEALLAEIQGEKAKTEKSEVVDEDKEFFDKSEIIH